MWVLWNVGGVHRGLHQMGPGEVRGHLGVWPV